MNTVFKKTAIAFLAVGVFSFAASAESLYRSLKTAAPVLTNRKDALKAINRTIATALSYERLTGSQMSEDRVMEIFKLHARDIVMSK